MQEWLVATNTFLAIPLQLLGFGLALWQIRKAVNSSRAAKEASQRTEEKISGNLLLVILPQLTQTETNLEWAVSQTDRHATIHYLGSWRWQAGQLRGLLARSESEHEELMTKIQASIAAAADTKIALQHESADIPKRSKSALKAIAVVTGLVGELSSKNQVDGTTGNV